MARARNIKPGFFRNADLVELSVEARLLFIGLWTIADREGRLEDRPKQIKMEIYPADSFDINSLLSELASTDMLLRYEVGGKRYLQIVNFTRHQNPHKDERQSTIPPPDGLSDPSGPADHDEHHASTVQTPCEHHASTVQIGLIPDSLIPDSLIPDSLIPDSLTNTSAAGGPGVDARDDPPAADAAVRFDAAEFLVEQGADPQTAADYLDLRKAKKATSSRTALRSVVSEADKAGLPLQDVLTTCCARGWAGFRAEWTDQPARAGPRQTIHEQRKKTLDELTGRSRAAQKSDPRDITAEVIRIA
jgi:hypothetical protein